MQKQLTLASRTMLGYYREELGPDSLCKAHCTASKGMTRSQGTFDP